MGKDKRCIMEKCKNTKEELDKIFNLDEAHIVIYVEQTPIKGIGECSGYILEPGFILVKPRVRRFPTTPDPKKGTNFITVLGMTLFIMTMIVPSSFVKSYKIEVLPS